ncbi:MAG: prepilin-type N-terminal cleavage/methylation domain-containing protein [Planctomycetes bacterium]|nr:prepilin-type N-terminal cleavage/methylation domain-containing protein [Planctomycetota bacterium]
MTAMREHRDLHSATGLAPHGMRRGHLSHHAAPTAMRRRAFTIVELLVVVAIIALLIAILLPSLAKARYNARSLVCSSNKHQVATITLMYAQDFKGYYPNRFNGTVSHHLPFWFGTASLFPTYHTMIEKYYGPSIENKVPTLLVCSVTPDGVLRDSVGWPGYAIYRGNVNLWAGWDWKYVAASACNPVLPLDQMPIRIGDVPQRPLVGDLIEYMTGDSVSGFTGWVTPHSYLPDFHYRAIGNPEDISTDPQPFALGDGSVHMAAKLQKVFRDDGYGSKWWMAPGE